MIETKRIICAAATGCERAQDGSCPNSVAQTQRDVHDFVICVKTGKAVNWREI